MLFLQKRFRLVLILLFISIICKAQNQEESKLLFYPQNIFDSDTCCWRYLSSHNKDLEAAKLVESYLKKSKLIINKHSLKWHAGQLFAEAGDYKKAKSYFNKTNSIFVKWFAHDDDKSWYYYVKGNIAFLDRNKTALKKILEIWSNKFARDKNYYALTRLYDNWDKPYGYNNN